MQHKVMSSGCGAVGREVAFDTRDPKFKSSHRQFYLLSTVLNRKDENKENRHIGNGPI